MASRHNDGASIINQGVSTRKVPKIFSSLFPTYFQEEDVFNGIVNNKKNLWGFYGAMTSVEHNKEARIRDYESLVLDPIIYSAMEMIAEDTFQIDNKNKSLFLESKDKEIIKLCDNFIDGFSIEQHMADLALANPIYGEVPILVDGAKNQGITNINWHINPVDFWRFQSGSLFGFMTKYERDSRGKYLVLPPWRMVHCFYRKSYRRTRFEELKKIKVKDKEVILDDFTTLGALENIRSVYKKLMLSEDSLVIARLDRAPLKRVLYVDVGKASPKKKVEIMREFKSNYKRETDFNPSNYFDSETNPLTYGQELFIPLSNGIKSVEKDEWGGDVDVKSIVDVDMLFNKLFAGLGVPKAYLNYYDDLPSSIGEGPLLRMDIRYARKVKNNRQRILDSVYRLLQINGAYYNVDINPDNLALRTNAISTAEEKEQRQIVKDNIEYSQEIIDLLESIGYDFSREPNTKFATYVLTDLVNITDKPLIDIIRAAESDQTVKDELKTYMDEQAAQYKPRRHTDDIYETIMREEYYKARYKASFDEDPDSVEFLDVEDTKKRKRK